MTTGAQVAAVRVKRGARWLDENFPGWETRIKPKTLELSDPSNCICGQVFKGKKRGLSGYSYASDTLFTEANKWINGIVKMQTKSQGLVEDDWGIRAARVATALGFESGPVISGWSDDEPAFPSDAFDVEFGTLQNAWENLLAKRGVK